VICIGLGGLGKWQVEEVKAFIHQCVDRDIPVIPVLLRGVEIFPERLIFLRERNYVLLNDVQSIDRIVQGINHQDSPLKTEPLSVKQKLENLYAEKKSAEQKIVYLSQEIGKLEAFLKDENNPQQETILSWLSQRSSLAKTYGLKSLRQFSDLNQYIRDSKEAEKIKNQFYWEIESYLELIYYAIIAKSTDILDNPSIFPSLSDPDCYENANSDLYRIVLDKIKENIPSSISEELRQSTANYFNYLKNRLSLDD